jgi:hyperosmotically inducible periplasmic protein
MMKVYSYTAAGLLVSGLLLTGACRDGRQQGGQPAGDLGSRGPTAGYPERTDTTIATEIRARYYGEDAIRGRLVEVRVQDGTVTLAGHVDSDAARQRAEQIAQNIEGVQRVDNQLRVDAQQVTGGMPPPAGQPQQQAARDPQQAPGQPGQPQPQPQPAPGQQQPQPQTQPAPGQAQQAARDAQPPAPPPALDPAQPTGREPLRDDQAPQRAGDPGVAPVAPGEQAPPPPRVPGEPSRPAAAGDQAMRDDEQTVNAEWVTTKIQSQYFLTGDVAGGKIEVTTSDTGVVTLAGEVESEEARGRAVQIAQETEGVRQVDNQLRVGTGARAVGQPGVAQQDRPMGDRPAGEVARAGEGEPVDDRWLTTKIQSQYFMDAEVSDRNIEVETREGVVTLRGEVHTEAERRQALAVARNTDGVREVNDELRVVAAAAAGPAGQPQPVAGRAAGQPVDDTWVTTKIQSKFFLEQQVKGSDVDVATRDGVVTLRGAVESDQARQTAETIARETEGVSRVVNELRVAPADTADGVR